jgi:hypothetical protein
MSKNAQPITSIEYKGEVYRVGDTISLLRNDQGFEIVTLDRTTTAKVNDRGKFTERIHVRRKGEDRIYIYEMGREHTWLGPVPTWRRIPA